MVKCNAVLSNGEIITVYAKDFVELAEKLKDMKLSAIEAHAVKVSDIRQGKEWRNENA